MDGCSVIMLMKTRAMLLQGEPCDATVNLDT